MEKVVVSVAEEHLDDLPDVVDRVRAAGMVVEDVLDATGVLTGTIEAGAIGTLAAVPGVADVERQRSYQLPPPDSDLQ
ncbi:MAG: hypothetical protein ACRDRZ_18710 [Pseudonocardiaceae bacterium]